MIFIKWFGWSVCWMLPLLVRSVATLLARKSVFAGKGAIRIWLGSLFLFIGSSAIESLVRAQFNTADDGATGDLFGFALMDMIAGKMPKALAVVLMFVLAGLGLNWLVGSFFGGSKANEQDEHPELDLAPPRRGSIESERTRIANNRYNGVPAGAERRSSTTRSAGVPVQAKARAATPFEARSSGNRFPAPIEKLQAKQRDGWQVPLSSLSKQGTRPAQQTEHTGRGTGKWPSFKTAAEQETRARPESEWAAFESLRPTDAMMARAAASTAITAASQAAHASITRASHMPVTPIEPQVPPSIARHSATPPVQPTSPLAQTRSIRISSVGRAAPQAPENGAVDHQADAVPTRLMRALQEAELAKRGVPPAMESTSAATPAAPVIPVAPDVPQAPVPTQIQIAEIPPAEVPMAPMMDMPSTPIEPVPASAPMDVAPVEPVIETSFAELQPPLTPEMPPMNVAPEPVSEMALKSEFDFEPEPMEPFAPLEFSNFRRGLFDEGSELSQPEPAAQAAADESTSFPVRVNTPAPVITAVEPEFERPHVDIPLPALDLLDEVQEAAIVVDAEQLNETGRLIEQRLKEFKVPVTVLGAEAGPVITRFEVEPAQGVRGAQVVNLMKDLSRALGLTSIRVVETIPGKTCMGLELPNARRQMIKLAEIVRSEPYRKSSSRLTIAMGKDITGQPVVTDLARAPHMLVAGTTGSGKSVAINAMILSLLYKATPDEVRMIMIDPKMLELSIYEGIPHLLAPVVTDMREAAHALNWAVEEMERRYKKMSKLGVRNLAGYNQKLDDAHARGEKIPNPFSLTPDAPEPLDKLPTIVIVIDELADLMMVVGKKVEELIARLAQKARAAGIHLILATQRPSVDVITGLIKANIPTRVAFQVSSKIDSRTVLDQMGAESLLGHGDMLFLPPGSGYPQRVHGAFVSDEEVHRVVEYLKSFGEPNYIEAILSPPEIEEAQADMFSSDASDPESDPLYDEAVAFVLQSRRASISSVQRQFRIGYNRAARLVEQMEKAGVLSAMSRNGSRDILVPPSGGEE